MSEKMEDAKLKYFLEGYVDLLRTEVDVSGDMPLSFEPKMASGCIRIRTVDGRRLGGISLDEGGGPSMPIGPAAMTYAKLIVDLVNGYFEFLKNGDKKDDNTNSIEIIKGG